MVPFEKKTKITESHICYKYKFLQEGWHWIDELMASDHGLKSKLFVPNSPIGLYFDRTI
jgi:hypothetical protein